MKLLSFNTALLGLFIGYLMGLVLLSIFDLIVSLASLPQNTLLSSCEIAFFLVALSLGVILTTRGSKEFAFSIPFVKFSKVNPKTKEIILDITALSDPRIIDLAATGLLDGRLILPRFLLNDLYAQEEAHQQALENLRKLKSFPELHLTFHDTDFSELKENNQKVLRLSRLLSADILMAGQKLESPLDDAKIINLHALAIAFKPLMQRGEYLQTKIQRHGKEERQGVGYLEDGTMIVVNGGGDYIGKTIKACVLSIKHTTTGRMIFCNVASEE